MENLYDRLQAILKLDEQSLKDLVSRALDALNVDQTRRAQILKDLPAYRARAQKLTPEELNALVSALGGERAAQIIKTLEGAHE